MYLSILLTLLISSWFIELLEIFWKKFFFQNNLDETQNDDTSQESEPEDQNSFLKTPVFNKKRKYQLDEKYQLGSLVGKKYALESY